MFKYFLRYFIFLLNRFQTFLTFHFRGLTSFFLFVFITFFREKYCCQTITPSWVKDEKIDRSKQKKKAFWKKRDFFYFKLVTFNFNLPLKICLLIFLSEQLYSFFQIFNYFNFFFTFYVFFQFQKFLTWNLLPSLAPTHSPKAETHFKQLSKSLTIILLMILCFSEG